MKINMDETEDLSEEEIEEACKSTLKILCFTKCTSAVRSVPPYISIRNI